ncbi:xaa-His dipeptidase [Acetobacterium bakii]|uniref:Xaa-His dipeptidase n=1 Tax=Acetobacterium bakii TaxID=52689 RepID=A0A0L6U2D5_9FIRM|nr:xaa-His dipeptidase [Acetobacterium bakii]
MKTESNLDVKAFLADLKGLLKIESTNNEAGMVTSEAPLGTGINDAIDYLLDLGKNFGFKTKNLDGYCGYIEMGEGDEMVAMLNHVDTVAVGGGWTVPPFDLTLQDDKIYGRGAIDNKGPAMVSLYAMKALAETGIPLNKRVRLIIGGDEEGDAWRCMKRYKDTEELPGASFSPDSRFPAIFAEKGMLRICLKKALDSGTNEMTFFSGNQINTVPDYAKAIVDGVTYKSYGKSAHASEPDNGVNAIFRLAQKLKAREIKHPFLELLEVVSLDGFNIRISDEISGALTLNPSIARVDAEEAVLECDIRYPVSVEIKDIEEQIAAAVKPYGFSFEILEELGPLHVDRESALVKSLQKVYREYSGDSSGPMTSGGATYARAFDNAVAFGGRFPGEANMCHQTDEYWSLESMKKNFDIILKALEVLAK